VPVSPLLAAPASRPVNQEVADIEIIGYDPDPVHQEAIKLFTDAHPEIQLTWTPVPGGWPDYLAKVNTRIAAGDPPDMTVVATYGPPINWSKKGLLADLKTFTDVDPDFEDQPVPQKLLDLYSVEGKLFGMPKDYVSHAVIYNKAIFDEAGVEPPVDGWTWADLVEKATALTSGEGVDKIFGWMTETGPWVYEQYLWANDGPGFFDRRMWDLTTPTAADPKNVEALQWLVDTINTWGISPSPEQLSAQDASTRQLSGNLAMWHASTISTVSLLQNSDKIDWYVVPLPRAYEGGPLVSMMWTSGFGIVSTTEFPDQAWSFLKHMSIGDGAEVLGRTGFSIPAGKPEAFLTDAMIERGGQIFLDVTNADVVANDSLGVNHNEILVQVIIPNSEAAFLGDMTPEEALQAIQTGMEDILAANAE
jgi:multiple sugar transport system substrate-binding protein